jgi:hypothetical protein
MLARYPVNRSGIGLFREATMLRYLAAFSNERGQGPVAQLFSDDAHRIEAFVTKYDRPGLAVYRCVSPLRSGATRRSVEDVACIDRLCVDIDFKDLVEIEKEVDDKLSAAPRSRSRPCGEAASRSTYPR